MFPLPLLVVPPHIGMGARVRVGVSPVAWWRDPACCHDVGGHRRDLRCVPPSTLDCAVELGRLTRNPMDKVKRRGDPSVEIVDRRVVVNLARAACSGLCSPQLPVTRGVLRLTLPRRSSRRGSAAPPTHRSPPSVRPRVRVS
jgi:hypothetical protein